MENGRDEKGSRDRKAILLGEIESQCEATVFGQTKHDKYKTYLTVKGQTAIKRRLRMKNNQFLNFKYRLYFSAHIYLH